MRATYEDDLLKRLNNAPKVYLNREASRRIFNALEKEKVKQQRLMLLLSGFKAVYRIAIPLLLILGISIILYYQVLVEKTQTETSSSTQAPHNSDSQTIITNEEKVENHDKTLALNPDLVTIFTTVNNNLVQLTVDRNNPPQVVTLNLDRRYQTNQFFEGDNLRKVFLIGKDNWSNISSIKVYGEHSELEKNILLYETEEFSLSRNQLSFDMSISLPFADHWILHFQINEEPFASLGVNVLSK